MRCRKPEHGAAPRNGKIALITTLDCIKLQEETCGIELLVLGIGANKGGDADPPLADKLVPQLWRHSAPSLRWVPSDKRD